MATKTKKRAARKAPAPSTNGKKGQPWSWFDKATADRVVALRDKEDKDWGAIATAVKATVGKALLLYKTAKLTPKEKITGTDAEVGKAIARLREKDKMSEGDLMARTGFAPGRLHALYEAATGRAWSDFRIGKGGRYPDGSKPAARPRTKATTNGGGKAKETKAAAKRTKAATVANLVDMTDDAAAAALEGRLITVASSNGGKPRKIRIDGTVKVAKTKTGLRAASFTDDEKKQRVIDLATIKSVR